MAKSEKKALESEKCANMAPTCGGFGLYFLSLGPPPSKEKQYVNASIKAVGSNTPGAASSAADLAPSWRPKRLQNRGQDAQKSMFKNSMFSGPRFGRVFGRLLGPKMHEKRKNEKLAKTLKIVIFLWEN